MHRDEPRFPVPPLGFAGDEKGVVMSGAVRVGLYASVGSVVGWVSGWAVVTLIHLWPW